MSKYSPPQIDRILSSMTILVDTREQDTEMLRRRCEGFNAPYRRATLSAGDYMAEYQSVDSDAPCVFTGAAIERKSGIDEICTNFTTGRARFAREFERAKQAGCRIHLIVENGSYEKIYAHKYQSQLLPKSLIASLLSWQARYDMQIHFVKSELTGRLIADALRYSLREWLINQ